MSNRCPSCTSENVYYSKKKGIWICEECELEFAENDSTEYRASELWEVAPTALALSYHQLHEYVKEQNIGCTLFLIRDVFELMIKLPVTIIFNGIHELNKESEFFSALLASNIKVAKLYEYSMQMLSTGKWWECVRLASSLDESVFANDSTMEHTNLYADTIAYLKELHKKLYFKEPGKQKISMVTWRNRTLGHSCLADNPKEKYSEIPYILEMFKTVGDIGIEYYKKVCFADGNKNPLRGVALNRTESEVYIQYIPGEDGQATYAEIHNFIAGRDNNLSCFDGFEKGKAYLLNYGNGERYRDQHLSEWLTNHQKTLEAVSARSVLSDEDVLADNLETKDINNLEEQLSAGDDIIGVSFLGRWLMDAVGACEKGMLLLTAERGLGKSTFCSTVDPFENLEIKYDDEAYAEELEEFLSDVAVRVWHFNSEYRSRKDIFIPGIRDALLTLDPENSNKIRGRLESQYNNLVSCAEDLRSLYFTECLNNTMGEYRARTDKQKLLLILDGIDEVSDIGVLCSFIPDPTHLDEDVYILLTCRTKQEIKENEQLAEFVESTQFEGHLDFTRNNLTITKNTDTETHNGNVEYRDVVARYVEAILREQGRTATSEQVAELATAFEYRFSSLAAYRKLCRLSPAFNDKVGTDLFGVFMHQVEINAPETYVKRLKWILNTLVCAGEPITLRELAFLSGERYISYRLLGMMNDIQAFIKVTRSSRGNCYELSHSQWEEAVKALIPYGDIYFRKQCNELLSEMEAFFNEDNIELILEKTYEGELWLLKHILGIYNRNWKELKENWFEEIRIGSFEYLIQLFLKSSKILNTYFTMSNIDEPYKLMINYSAALEAFKEDVHGLNRSKHNKIFITNQILLLIPQIYVRLNEKISEKSSKRVVVERLGRSWRLLADVTESNTDKKLFREHSLSTYVYLLTLINGETEKEQYAMYLYRIGRTQQLLGRNQEALDHLVKFTKLISDDNCSYDLKEYVCRGYIAVGEIYEGMDQTERAFEYYARAHCLAKKNVHDCECVTYLDVLALSESVMSDYYEDFVDDIDQAIEYRKQSLKNIEYVLTMVSSKEYEEIKYCSLYKLGELYIKHGKFYDSIDFLEEALYMEEQGFSSKTEKILNMLVVAYESESEKNKSTYYKRLLNQRRDNVYRASKAVTEVLALMEHIPRTDIAKLPIELIDYLNEHAAHDYSFKIDPSKGIASQLSNEALSLLSLIEANFWTDKTFWIDKTSKLIKNDEERRMRLWIYIKKLLLQLFDHKAIVQHILDAQNLDCFNKVYTILEQLPKKIRSAIPIESLIWLKNQCDRSDLNVGGEISIEISIETLALLKNILGDLIYMD